MNKLRVIGINRIKLFCYCSVPLLYCYLSFTSLVVPLEIIKHLGSFSFFLLHVR